ncbi:MAG: diguanylate cyclase (GGDEF)-like protein [Oleiphilaceae bacterium]
MIGAVSGMLVKDVMNKEPLIVSLETPLNIAISRMADTKSSCILVVTDNKPVGIVTERDVCILFAEVLSGKEDLDRQVQEIMTPEPVCVSEYSLFKDALMLSRSRKLRHLPVLNDQDQLAGLVTQTNLVDAYAGLVEKQDELESSVEQLKLLSLEDPLLRIGNRRAMEVDLAFTEADAVRHHKTYAVALLDIDFFKAFNDTYGHQTGDDALRVVAQTVKQTVRTSDRVFRYGGEEILILMPEANMDSAFKCADRARMAVEHLQIPHEGSQLGVLTLSGGVASEKEGEWIDLVEKADKALYRSKNSGRNCTTKG